MIYNQFTDILHLVKCTPKYDLNFGLGYMGDQIFNVVVLGVKTLTTTDKYLRIFFGDSWRQTSVIDKTLK